MFTFNEKLQLLYLIILRLFLIIQKYIKDKMHGIYIFIQAIIKGKFTIIVYDVLAMLILYSSYIRRFHIKIGTRHFPIKLKVENNRDRYEVRGGKVLMKKS